MKIFDIANSISKPKCALNSGFRKKSYLFVALLYLAGISFNGSKGTKLLFLFFVKFFDIGFPRSGDFKSKKIQYSCCPTDLYQNIYIKHKFNKFISNKNLHH